MEQRQRQGDTGTIAQGVAKPKNHTGAMPPMGGVQLSKADLAAVADYVWARIELRSGRDCARLRSAIGAARWSGFAGLQRQLDDADNARRHLILEIENIF
jgi:hypothetical protein